MDAARPEGQGQAVERVREWAGLIAWLLVTFAVAWLGSRFEPGLWYERIGKPSWTPPEWIFAPVWTFLYFSMAVAAWLVWRRHGFDGAGFALGFFLVQLVLNALWSIFFFGMQSPGGALVDIIILWVVLLATVVLFWRAHRVAGLLMAPVFAWVSFAVALNLSIWVRNPVG